MSEAENDAIDAGTHEWDEDDFGHPYLARRAAPSPALTREALLEMSDAEWYAFLATMPLQSQADWERARKSALGTPPPAPTSTREETP